MIIFQAIKKKSLFTALGLCLFMIANAQAKQPAAAASTGYNNLTILLMVMIIVLAFVIWGMGQVLSALGRQLVEKEKSDSKIFTIVMLFGFSLLSEAASAQDTVAANVVTPADYGGLSQSAFYMFLTIIGTEVVVILFLAFMIRRLYTGLLPEKTKPVAVNKFRSWWTGLDKKVFTKAVSVEKEADILLDHDYDGIKELDNSLPPWWKYGFYITIGISIVYLLNFHVLGLGKNPTEEYNAEMEKARIEKEIYDAQNKDKVDENNVPMADAAGIALGKEMFEANCAACHLKNGGGSVGPNLTDNYWLHKGSLNDIFKTITNGYPDKGMQAWNSKFNPKEISQIASFIKSIKGTNPPDGKLPQGDMYMDEPAADSAKVANAEPVKKIN